ncbi:hypothetical protein [Amycolatopsis sp. GM8]|uniref:hypothetical protein n=1 Tax=Amycolatopsis sp. GM8 TaxID=2896530 RepID=UPI001F288C36|nr:hypothetical protein [Amycolatopsis sp. GM8]
MDHVLTLRPSLRRGPTALLFFSYVLLLTFLILIVPFVPSVSPIGRGGSQVFSWAAGIGFFSLIIFMYMRQVFIAISDTEVKAGSMYFRSKVVPRDKISYISRGRRSGGWMAFVGHDGHSLAVVRNVWTETQIEQLKTTLGVPIRHPGQVGPSH